MDRRQKASGSGAAPVTRSRRRTADPIAFGLQKLFEPILNEPVPDEFLAILDRVDAERDRRTQAGGPVDPSGSAGL